MEDEVIIRSRLVVIAHLHSGIWNFFGVKYVSTKMASYNIVKAIWHQISTSPIKFGQKWVKAHQDGDKWSKRLLDTWALSNIECNKAATRMRNKCFKRNTDRARSTIQGHTSGEEWVIWTEEHDRIDNNIQIHNSITMPSRIIWLTIGNIKRELMKAMVTIWTGNHMERPWRHSVDKRFGLWNTVRVGQDQVLWWPNEKFKMHDNAKCPRRYEDKSTQHVVQCQSQENLAQFQDSMEPLLKRWLTETTTPSIASAVRTHMNAY